MAWTAILPSLARYEVLDISVNPEIVVESPGGDYLPNYEDVKEKSGTDNFLAPSRGPSPNKKTVPLPQPHERSRSRSPSPSSGMAEWAKSLFGKRAQ